MIFNNNFYIDPRA